jgi:hypothetical protein
MKKSRTKRVVRGKRRVCQTPLSTPLVVKPSLSTLEFWGFPVGKGQEGRPPLVLKSAVTDHCPHEVGTE